jgi:hypothetical protein
MDSMRPLTNSLPPARRPLNQPDLLSDFKAAALSVTNLYKTAASAQDKARTGGYQDAVEDLISFLDREELGLMDGEGWRVRQWATERLSEEMGGMKKVESDEEGEAEEERGSSPEVHRKNPPVPQLVTLSSELTAEENPRRSARSEPPPDQVPTMNEFSFRANQAYPTNYDRETMEMDISANTIASSTPTTPHPTSSEATTPASVRIMARPNRRPHTNHNRTRNNANNHNSNVNAATLNVNLGSGAGSKRKLPYSDFFDISGINFDNFDRKDGAGGKGGGKRGRFV